MKKADAADRDRASQRRPRRRRLLLALGLACVLTACDGDPTLIPLGPNEGRLYVFIRLWGLGGQPTPIPLTPHPEWTPVTQCFCGSPIRVAVMKPDDPQHVVAEQVTRSGLASFRLPAARYWVFLPLGNQPYLSSQLAFEETAMPDREGVFDWKEVLVPAGSTVRTALIATQVGS